MPTGIDVEHLEKTIKNVPIYKKILFDFITNNSFVIIKILIT